MTLSLLLGAGFSRNWGGWLATEAFEYLLGSPEVRCDPDLTQILWQNQHNGGFERALELLQEEAQSNPSRKAQLNRLNTAVGQMFDDMNRSYFNRQDFESNHANAHSVREMLTRFDVIYSLNQDLLVEHFYIDYLNDSPTNKGRRWSSHEMPGMCQLAEAANKSWALSRWKPDGTLPTGESRADVQPFIKLHGSSNWVQTDDSNLMILGGGKAQSIAKNPLLNSYAQIFEESLSTSGSKLVVIGYSFGDPHINAAIVKGARRGLKMFIIDPCGAQVGMKFMSTWDESLVPGTDPLADVRQLAVVGASRRGLLEIFGGDAAEYGKLERFLDS